MKTLTDIEHIEPNALPYGISIRKIYFSRATDIPSRKKTVSAIDNPGLLALAGLRCGFLRLPEYHTLEQVAIFPRQVAR